MFFAVKNKTAGKEAKAGKLDSGPYAGFGWENPDRWSAQLANQIQGFRTLDRSDARENNQNK